MDGPEGDRYAMFDVAYYLNSTREGVPVLCNVSAHYDPGLVSINWLSTAPGLQMHPSDGPWVDVPLSTGVLWAGGAAKSSSILPGVHRVLFGNKPRLAVWSEAVVPAQLSEIDRPVAAHINVLPRLDDDLWLAANPMPNDELHGALASRIERMYGIPSTKSFQIAHCAACGNSSFMGSSDLTNFCKPCGWQVTAYCNDKCQREHWPTHRSSCVGLKGNGLPTKSAPHPFDTK